MRFTIAISAASLTVFGLLLGLADLRAEEQSEEGITRISDNQPTVSPEPDPFSSGDANIVYQSGEFSGCPGCRTPKRFHSPVHAWLSRGDVATYSPDYGWSPPAKHRVRRAPVQYHRYWPVRWMGEPGSGISPNAQRFPVVYTPTDTTQLGFYYQQVPQWQPNPAMIPPAPWPSQWHHRQTPPLVYNPPSLPMAAPQPYRQGVAPQVPTNNPDQSTPKAIDKSASNGNVRTTEL